MSTKTAGMDLRAAAPITLLTDFGYSDPYVGVMKGVILSINPSALFVDITHVIAAQSVVQGAFVLAASWRFFPQGSIHLAVVDPGVGSARAPLVLEADGHFFVGPDNGIFTRILEQSASFVARTITAERFRRPKVSSTFHGRDIFAPAAAWLSRGVEPGAFGPLCPSPVRVAIPSPVQLEAGWLGEVVYVDTFGNLVTNLGEDLVGSLEGSGERVARIAGRDIPVRGTYSDVHGGELVAVVDSFGTLEVSVNGGSACDMLEAGAGVPVRVGVKR